MENFYLITNELKDEEMRFTRQVQDYIHQNGRSFVAAQKDSSGHLCPDDIPADVDGVIVLGGDGTLIRVARDLVKRDLPLLGINIGNLGYLTEADFPAYQEVLDALFEDRFEIEERMMLTGEMKDGIRDVAINDIVITREGSLRVIPFNVYVNKILLNSYAADGMIISTPTGSTGYNLSAGGPVVEPTAKTIVLTPICSHALNTSSVVFSAKDEIEVEICPGQYERTEKAVVTFDGANAYPIQTNERIRISQAMETTKLIKLSQESFIKNLREKMKGN